MQDNTNISTLAVKGFTPYAQVPRWILRSGDSLSGNAVRLYGVIMSYADNETRAAFPSRERLAEDMGVSVATVKRSVKDLEDFGAVIVERRRNKRTGNFYANHYILVFENPRVTSDPRREVTHDPITTPTNLTTPTHSTSDLRSDDNISRATQAPARAEDHLPKDSWNFLKGLLQDIGYSIAKTGGFWNRSTQRLWDDFVGHVEDLACDLEYVDQIVYLMQEKWTVGSKVQMSYEAGKELTILFNTARDQF